MIQTSYFAKAASLPNAVAISQGIPVWYKGAQYKQLAPSWDMIHTKDPELYRRRYTEEVLARLDPKQVALNLDGRILLCHEKDSTHCHRRIVAEWLEASLGIEVPELDYAVKARNEKKMRVIYGQPGEYATLGLNLYTGCSHGCLYCYNKREDRYQGPYDTPAKRATLKNIKHDLQILQSNHDRRSVHMSFVGDPYDLGRKDDDKPSIFEYYSEEELEGILIANDSYTRTVLKAFRLFDQPFQILTKGGTKAVKDFDLYGPNDWFGVTLTFDNDPDSKKWEPGAALPGDRIAALKEAHYQTINTWVSCEPVIDPAQTLHLIELTHEFVDFFWVGKLNHHPKIEEKIDWSKFRKDTEALLKKYGRESGSGYRIKRELIEASKSI